MRGVFLVVAAVWAVFLMVVVWGSLPAAAVVFWVAVWVGTVVWVAAFGGLRVLVVVGRVGLRMLVGAAVGGFMRGLPARCAMPAVLLVALLAAGAVLTLLLLAFLAFAWARAWRWVLAALLLFPLVVVALGLLAVLFLPLLALVALLAAVKRLLSCRAGS